MGQSGDRPHPLIAESGELGALLTTRWWGLKPSIFGLRGNPALARRAWSCSDFEKKAQGRKPLEHSCELLLPIVRSMNCAPSVPAS